MADLVLNEWLWSDLRGETSAERMEQCVQLLLVMQSRPDRIIVVQDSPFSQKAWRLAREARDLRQRLAVRLFKDVYMADPAKCLLLDSAQLPFGALRPRRLLQGGR